MDENQQPKSSWFEQGKSPFIIIIIEKQTNPLIRIYKYNKGREILSKFTQALEKENINELHKRKRKTAAQQDAINVWSQKL